MASDFIGIDVFELPAHLAPPGRTFRDVPRSKSKRIRKKWRNRPVRTRPWSGCIQVSGRLYASADLIERLRAGLT